MSYFDSHSLIDSLKQKLSHLSWQRGCVNFFNESVPFSFSNGKEYVELCANIIDKFQHDKNKKHSILECGAGLGIFSQQLIDSLNDLNINSHYILSDYSEEIVNQFKKKIKEPSSVSVRCIDFTKDFSHLSPNVIICNYLFDTLPVHCLEFENGKLYEWKISATFKKSSMIKDTTVIPFKDLDENAMRSVLENSISSDKLSLLSRINECLDYSWSKHVCDVYTIDPSGFLFDFLSFNNTKNMFFNFSPLLFQSLDNIIKSASDDFVLIFYNLSQLKENQFTQINACYGEFGLCTFYKVPLFLLSYFCKQRGMHIKHSTFDSAENQFGLISSSPITETLFSDWSTHTEPGNAIEKAGKKIEEIREKDALNTLLNEYNNQFSENQRLDYVYCFKCAQACMSVDDFDKALEYLIKIVDIFDVMAANAVILMSKCYRKKGQHKDALACIDKAIRLMENYDMLWLEKAFILSEMNEINDCLHCIKKYFNYVVYNPQFNLEVLLK